MREKTPESVTPDIAPRPKFGFFVSPEEIAELKEAGSVKLTNRDIIQGQPGDVCSLDGPGGFRVAVGFDRIEKDPDNERRYIVHVSSLSS